MSRQRRRGLFRLALVLVAIGVLALVAIPAFTGSTEQDRIANAVQDLQQALRRHDAAGVCSRLVTPPLTPAHATAQEPICRSTIGLLGHMASAATGPTTVLRVTVHGPRATALVRQRVSGRTFTNTYHLAEIAGRWRIVAQSL